MTTVSLSFPTTPDPGIWRQLHAEVIRSGLCTHCGTCVGLAPESLHMEPHERGPLPVLNKGAAPHLPSAVWDVCPGKGIDYPTLYQTLFDRLPENWLMGCYRQLYIGYACAQAIRQRAASGGVITQTLVHLLASGQIDGAVVVQQGRPQPWLAQAVIARTADEIIAASQSVYAPVPVNVLLPQMAAFPGRLAYVGLPDQVAALRRLQQLGHPGARKVDYVLGPYVGTNLYAGAMESYLRAQGVRDLNEVTELRYREGEWPGYLQIKTRSGRVLRTEKFYYNYLIPFFITQATLYAVDFTNELTDISVGDAWHPRFETQGGGFSVVVARTEKGEALLQQMQQQGLLALEPTTLTDALSMHGHMIDFKKRGSFIRLGWRAALGKPVPDYGYRPVHLPWSRKLVEVVISTLFVVCGTTLARRLVEWAPIGVIGPLFNTLRKSWKQLSKPVKRKGLANSDYFITPR